MKQKLYNLKMKILRDKSISDGLKEDLANEIFEIEKELASISRLSSFNLKDFWSKLTIIIIYIPSIFIDFLISLFTNESYLEARKTTIKSFKRVWYNI